MGKALAREMARPSTINSYSSTSSQLASGDRGDDADFVAVFDRGGLLFEEADVFPVDVDVDETAHVAGFVAQAVFQAGIGLVKIVDQLADVSPGGADGFEFRREFAEWSGNENGWHLLRIRS